MARYTYQGVVTPPAPTVTIVSGAGDIASATGTYYFWLQTRNRAGFSTFSTVVSATISANDRIDFTLPSSIRPNNNGQYVHSAYILAAKSNNPFIATIVCSVPLYQLDEVTERSLPITIQVGEDHHLEAGNEVDYFSDLPVNPCAGQRVYVEQDDREDPPVDVNTIFEYQPFAAVAGWYPAFDQTFSTYISDTTQQGGALVSINAAESVITSLYALSESIVDRSPSVPIGLWIINNGSQPVPAGSRIGMSLFIGNENVSNDFSGRFRSTFKGYVNTTTGVNSTSDGNGGTMLLINEPVDFSGETIEVLKLQRSLPVGEAVWIDVQCIATYEELNNRAPFGAKIKVSPFFFTFGATPIAPTPIGGAIASVQGSRLIVPGADLSVTALAGSGNVQFNDLGTAFSFWNREAQSLVLTPNTADQPIAITKEGFCFALDDLTGTTQLRALVGTVNGEGQVSSWSTPFNLNGSQNLSITIVHPTIVRVDYPDLIAGSSDGVFDCYSFRVYVKKTGGDTYYWDINKSANASTTGTIASTAGTLGNPPIVSNTFGLHRVTSFTPTPATGTAVLASGEYSVAIALVYLSNVTSINNSPDGGIITLSSTYTEALNDSSYWREVIGDPLLLRNYDRTLRPGMRIAISNSPDWYYCDSESILADDGVATIAVTGITTGRFRLGTDGLGAFGLLYWYNPATIAPPAVEEIRFNDDDLSLVTEIYASETDRRTIVSSILNTLNPGAILLITDESNPSYWALYSLTSRTDSGSYTTIVVSYLGHYIGSGSLSSRVRVTFANKGNTGATGATGAGFTGGDYDPNTGIFTFSSNDGLGFATDDLRGVNGITGFGLRFTFSSQLITPALSGQLRINSATHSLATQIFVSATDRNNASVGTIVNSLTPGSTLFVLTENDTTAYLLYIVSSAPTLSGSTYIIPVTYVGSGAIPITGNVSLSFGLKGEPTTIANEGTPLPVQNVINFVGGGVSVANGTGETIVTIDTASVAEVEAGIVSDKSITPASLSQAGLGISGVQSLPSSASSLQHNGLYRVRSNGIGLTLDNTFPDGFTFSSIPDDNQYDWTATASTVAFRNRSSVEIVSPLLVKGSAIFTYDGTASQWIIFN